mmetsp:Transcript_109276/g.288188  ORF Transcript_109276/g.288188 Transcript_109276/m.288188 type:complete len:90 (-) Transcript_109276:1103-1372(-)
MWPIIDAKVNHKALSSEALDSIHHGLRDVLWSWRAWPWMAGHVQPLWSLHVVQPQSLQRHPFAYDDPVFKYDLAMQVVTDDQQISGATF